MVVQTAFKKPVWYRIRMTKFIDETENYFIMDVTHLCCDAVQFKYVCRVCYTMGMQKRILNKWVIYGRVSGFALGFNVDKYAVTIDLGFWYIGLEF